MEAGDYVWTPKGLGKIMSFSTQAGRSVQQIDPDVHTIVVMLEVGGTESFPLTKVAQIRFRVGDLVKTTADPTANDSREVLGVVARAGKVTDGEQELLVLIEGDESPVQRLNRSVRHRLEQPEE